MATKIDWISLTLPLECGVSINPDTGIPELRHGFRDMFPHIGDWISSFPDLKVTGGNRIFDKGYRSQLGGFSIFQRYGRPFTLFEFSGTGVDALRAERQHMKIIRTYAERLTRLDVAVDYETDTIPAHFAEMRDNDRFSHYTDINSEDGLTYYVGSKKSERFCRVYRYADPHPRSHLLRVEFQLRSNYAKDAAELLKKITVNDLAWRLIKTFGFNHPLARLDGRLFDKIKAPPTSPKGGTERWLFAQVMPAIKKLIAEGSTEIVDIFQKQVYNELMTELIRKENLHGKEDLLTDLDSITR